MTTLFKHLPSELNLKLEALRSMVAARVRVEGRTDTLSEGLRYYRFSQSTFQQKKQLLMPGIVVVLQGRKMAQLNRETLTYDEMNYLVLSTETLCQGTVVTTNENKPYLALHLDLPVNILVKVITSFANQKPATSHQKSSVENFTQTIDIHTLEALMRLVSATDSALDSQTIAPLIIEEIIIRLLRSDAGIRIRDLAAISRVAMRIQDSMNFMQAQLHRALTVAELSQQAAMSPSHYAHSFREVAGVTPMRYLRDLRLERARNLLLFHGARPTEAAYSAGYENIEHFNREFKRRYASTPKQHLTEFKCALEREEDPQF